MLFYQMKMLYNNCWFQYHNQYDIPALVEEGDIPDDDEIINLGAWGNAPIVIEAIKKKLINSFEN